MRMDTTDYPFARRAPLALFTGWAIYMTVWLGMQAWYIPGSVFVNWLADLSVPWPLAAYAVFSVYFAAYIVWVVIGAGAMKLLSMFLLGLNGVRIKSSDWQPDSSIAWRAATIQLWCGVASDALAAFCMIINMAAAAADSNAFIAAVGALAGWVLAVIAAFLVLSMAGLSAACTAGAWLAIGWVRNMAFGELEPVPGRGRDR